MIKIVQRLDYDDKRLIPCTLNGDSLVGALVLEEPQLTLVEDYCKELIQCTVVYISNLEMDD